MDYQEELSLFKKEDTKFIGDLYASLNEICRGYISRQGLDTNIADDLLQESFMVFIDKVQKGKITQLTCPIKGYIWKVFLVKLKAYFRKSSKSLNLHLNIDSDEQWIELKLPPVIDKEVELFMEPSVEDLILELIDDNLGVYCKEILLGYYIDGIPLKDIAKNIGKSDDYNYVKVRKSRCMDLLRKKYEGVKNKIK